MGTIMQVGNVRRPQPANRNGSLIAVRSNLSFHPCKIARSFLTTLSLIVVTSSSVLAEDGSKERTNLPEPVVINTVLFESVGKPPTASVDFGSVQPGHPNNFVVKLTNGLQRRISYSRIDSTCACQSFSPTKGSVAPGKILELAFSLNIPSHPRGQLQYGVAELMMASGQPAGRIEFKYSFPTYIGFKTDMLLAEHSESEKVVRVPISLNLGESVDVSNHQFLIDGIQIKRQLVAKNGFIEFAPQDLNAAHRRLDIQLVKSTDETSEPIDELSLVISRKNEIEISPKVVRLSLDGARKRLVGSCFIKAAASREMPSVAASFQLGQRSTTLKCSKLSKSIGKISFSLPPMNFGKYTGRSVVAQLHAVAGDNVIEQKIWIVFPRFNVPKESFQ